jgi:hypothetical protein
VTAALVALVVAFALVLASLRPLFGPEPAPADDGSLADLQARREELVRSLRDLDLDFAMGKITEDDRDRLRADLEGRAVRILASIDAASADADATRTSRRRRRPEPAE